MHSDMDLWPTLKERRVFVSGTPGLRQRRLSVLVPRVPTETQWRWILRGALLWYFLLAASFIWTRPGLHYDEAIDVLAAVHLRQSPGEIQLPHDPGTWLCAGERCFPLMSARYIGSIKEYICLPLFAVFDSRTEVARLVASLLAAIGIIGLAALVKENLGSGPGAMAAWAMAVSPAYMGQTVFDNAAFAPWMGAFGLLCLAAASYLREQSGKKALLVGLACGAGIWARANFLWLLAAVLLALAVFAGRRAFSPMRHLAACGLGGVLGGLPFLVYQVNSGGGTWQAVGLHSTSESYTQRAFTRLVMFSETLLSDRAHRAMWNGPPMPAWQPWFCMLLVASSCCICLALTRRWTRERAIWPRTIALALLAEILIFFLSGLQVAEHHLITLLPIAVAVVLTAGWILLEERWRIAKAAIVVAAFVYVSSALFWQFNALSGLARTGGVGVWSDAVFALTERLATDFPKREPQILDWGLQNSIYVLSDGRIRTREIYGSASLETSDAKQPWIEEIRKGGLFILNGPENRQFPNPSVGFLRALAAGRPSFRRYLIPQRSGGTYAEIIDVRPDTLGAQDPDQLGPELSARLKADDAQFSSQSTGFYAVEQDGWRWTKKEFSVLLEAFRAPVGGTAKLVVQVNVPKPCSEKLGPITLSVRVGGHVLQAKTLTDPGDYTVTWPLKAGWLQPGANRFEFHLDKSLPPTAADARELGIVFVSAGLEPQ